MPDLPLVSVPGRSIDAEAMAALVAKVNGHPERRRVMRAIAQYTEALRSWVVGNEIPCLADLYMGVEAISKAVLRAHMGKSGKTEDELAMEWGVKNTVKLQQRRGLESECRKRLVFDGDGDTFKTARHVSDAFEHGFLDFGEIHKPARDVIITTAAHLRRCIIDLLNLDESCRATVLSSEYHTARGPLVLWRVVRGILVGSVDRLAATGQAYPILIWHSKLKAVTVGDDGRLGFQMDNRIDVKIGDGAQFRPEHFEVWDGSVLVQTSPPRRETIDATVERASEKRAHPRRLITLVRNALLWTAAKLEAQ